MPTTDDWGGILVEDAPVAKAADPITDDWGGVLVEDQKTDDWGGILVEDSEPKPEPASPDFQPTPKDFTFVDRILSPVGAGFANAPQTLKQMNAYINKLFYSPIDAVLGTKLATTYGDEIIQDAQVIKEANNVIATQAGGKVWGQLGSGLGENLAIAPLQIGTAGAAATGQGVNALRASINASSAFGGLQSAAADFGTRVQEEVKKGKPLQQAADEAFGPSVTAGLITGIVTKGFGATGIESVFQKEGVQGVASRVVDTLKQAGLEGAEEMTDQIGQEINNLATKDEFSLKQAVGNVLMAGMAGTLLGGFFSGVRQTAQTVNELQQSGAPETAKAVSESATTEIVSPPVQTEIPGFNPTQPSFSDTESRETLAAKRERIIEAAAGFAEGSKERAALDQSVQVLNGMLANKPVRATGILPVPNSAPTPEAQSQAQSISPTDLQTTVPASVEPTITPANEQATQSEVGQETTIEQAGATVVEPQGSIATPDERVGEGTEVAGTGEVAEARGGRFLPSLLAPSASPTSKVKGMDQVIRDLSEGFKIPIRFGRLTSTKAGGYFKKTQDLIGSRRANDALIVPHEIGHKIDSLTNISSDPSIQSELLNLGDPKTPGSLSSWTKSKTLKYKQGEGIAEFIRYWISEPEKASKLAPSTEAAFNTLLQSNPDWADTIKQAREDVQLWRSAQDEARLDSNISTSNPNKTKYGATQLTRDLVDDLHILRLAVDDAKALGNKVNPSSDPYINARLLRGSYGMADAFIRQGVADFTTKEVKLGTGLEQALSPVAGRIGQFRRWIIAMRARELIGQGKETGLVPEDVNAVAARYEADPDFQKAFQGIKDWNNAVLQYAVDAGHISEDSKKRMQAMNQDYVPFHRLFEIGAGEDSAASASGVGRGLNAGKSGSLKNLKGSTRPIIDPIETMIRNAYTIITASEKTAIASQVAKMANMKGMSSWVEEVRTPQTKQTVSLEKIRKQLEDLGADTSALADDEVLGYFQNARNAPFGENIIKVSEGGKDKFYRLNSDLYKTFQALDLDDSSKLIRILSSPSQVLRSGVVLDPSFGLANVIRDGVGSAVINRYGMLPFEASVKGIAAMIGNPKLVAEWKASGGENAIESTFFDRDKLQKFIVQKLSTEVSPKDRALFVLKSPLLALRWLTGVSETATRVGEFQKAYEANVARGMSEGDARRIAAFESRDRQDFAKGGAKTKIPRALAAFWNAAIQGNVAFASALKSRPQRTILQGLAYITIPKLIEQALNWNDEDYWDRPKWERRTFFLIPIGKDENDRTRFLRIPTPFLPGAIFGTLPGEMLAWFKKNDPKQLEGFPQMVLKDIVPNPAPQWIVTMMELNAGRSGYSFFRGRDIVPQSIAEAPSEYQWTEQTSLTARKLGQLAGLSPMKIDYAIASTTGGIGRQVTHNVIDNIIGRFTGEEPTASGIAPGARFITTPAGTSSQAVEDFYIELTRLREERAKSKMTGEPMDGADLGKLRAMEKASDLMSLDRRKAKATDNKTEKQRFYLDIVDRAKTFTDSD